MADVLFLLTFLESVEVVTLVRSLRRCSIPTSSASNAPLTFYKGIEPLSLPISDGTCAKVLLNLLSLVGSSTEI